MKLPHVYKRDPHHKGKCVCGHGKTHRLHPHTYIQAKRFFEMQIFKVVNHDACICGLPDVAVQHNNNPTHFTKKALEQV